MKLTVNGKVHDVDAEPETPLLWVLRDEIGVTGTKFGCGIAMCGACTVHVDGAPRRSCSLPIKLLDPESEITTIEGLGSPDVLHAVQEAWIEHNVAQCGFCQSGQIMSAAALLSVIDTPSDDDIDKAMSGNVCRCGTYQRIRAAIHDAAKKLNADANGDA